MQMGIVDPFCLSHPFADKKGPAARLLHFRRSVPLAFLAREGRQNLYREARIWGWLGRSVETLNPEMASSIGLSRRARGGFASRMGSQRTEAEEAATMAINVQGLQGQWNQLKGEVKKRWGQLSEDDLKWSGGNIDQLVGRIQQRTGETRESIEKYLDQLTAHGSSAVSTRWSLSAPMPKRSRTGCGIITVTCPSMLVRALSQPAMS